MPKMRWARAGAGYGV